MIADDDPHTVRFPTGQTECWQVVYWCNGAASGSENATRASLSVWRPNLGYCGIGEFRIPEDQPRLSMWLQSLEWAHEAGKLERSREIDKIIGAGRHA